MFYTKISYSVSKNAGKKDVDFRRTGTLKSTAIAKISVTSAIVINMPT